MATIETTADQEPEEWAEPSDEQAEEALSIGHRLGNWKSVASFVFAAAVLSFAILKGGINVSNVGHRLLHANLALFFGAFVVYYTTFPLRGLRWKVLLRNAYAGSHAEAIESMSIRGLTEIIYISWFVNCVVPAKLGDLYRAYLAKLWVHVSWSKTIGTVIAERLVDILVLSLLMTVTGLLVFHDKLGKVSLLLALGLGLAVMGIALLVLMKTMSSRIRKLVPHRYHEKYVSFEEGTLDSLRKLPLLLALTALIWTLEGSRLQLVFASLGVQTHVVSSIPFLPMLFFALATAVLTTVPFTPGGLGLVEAGLLGIMEYLGIPASDAAVVVAADRLLSYFSIAILGFIVYLISKRSHFRHPV